MEPLITTANLPERQRFAFWQETVCNAFFQVDCQKLSRRPFIGEITARWVNKVCLAHVLSCEQKVFRTPCQISRAREEKIIVNLHLKGNCLISQDGREAMLEPGDFTIYDSSRPHSALFDGDFEQFIFVFPREMWVRRIGQTERLTARAVRADTHFGGFVSNILNQLISLADNVEPEMVNRAVEVSQDLIIAAIGHLIPNQEISQNGSRVALLYRAKTFIEANLHDPDLSPKQVACTLQISLRYLQSLFKDEGETVSEWIWDRRLERCRRDLVDPFFANKSVTQIAFDCGFNNFSHFCHRFKSSFNISATEFRRAHCVSRLTSSHPSH